MQMTYLEAAAKLDEMSNEMRLKVEMYFLALTFTVTGLAIQSAKFSGNFWEWSMEIGAWCLLVASGFVTLWWLQGSPDRFSKKAVIVKLEGMLADVAPFSEDATFPDGKRKAQVIDELVQRKEAMEKSEDALRNMLIRLARWRNPLFIVGVVLLGVSRAYAGLTIL